ncbi:MAG TPA: hypothetical protein DDZ51_17855 [Planctomycetaceae bacterium]|nr:hypothetical protein [Planctomycetaceae bacterium]
MIVLEKFEMKKNLIFTIAIGPHQNLFRGCIQSQRLYALKHGYEFLVIDKAPRSLLPEEASWLKIGMIKAALLYGYDWVGFIDADCDVRPHAPCYVQQFERFGHEKCLYLAPGISNRLNAGVIFARNATGSVAFFDEVERNADIEVSAEDSAPYENGHVIHFARGNPALQVIDHRLWNNNSQLDHDSYIQHYSGGPLRVWYMENRIRWLFAKKLARKSKACLKKIGVNAFGKSVEEVRLESLGKVKPNPPMSRRLNELRPFYKSKYAVFKFMPDKITDI